MRNKIRPSDLWTILAFGYVVLGLLGMYEYGILRHPFYLYLFLIGSGIAFLGLGAIAMAKRLRKRIH